MTARTSSSGLRLLQELLEGGPGERVFTSEEAVSAGAAIGLSPGHVYKLLSELTAKAMLDRPRGHLYVMQAPFGGTTPVRSLAIAIRAVHPAAVSGDTARVHWGLQDQATLREEVISTPARIQWTSGVHVDGGDRLWTVAGGTIRFRRAPLRNMFGITTVRLDRDTVVPMFDRERAILELLAEGTPPTVELAAELLDTHREDIDLDRVREYAERLGIEAIPGARDSSVVSLP
jgi:predicted transcriptional regulator of viral defense system